MPTPLDVTSEDTSVTPTPAPTQPSQAQPSNQSTAQPATTGPVQPTQPSPQPSVSSNKPDAATQAGASIPPALVNNPAVPTQKMAVEADLNKTSPAPHHSWLNTAAEALAGGPRYEYKVDDAGNMIRTKIPVSTAHLGLAIALEALRGAAAGAGQHGPGATGRAAALGLQQGEKDAAQMRQDDQQAQQNAVAQSDQRLKVTEANLRNYQLATMVGTHSEEISQTLPDAYKPIADGIEDGSISLPGIQRVFETDAAANIKNGKTNVTNTLYVPYGDPQPIMENGQQKEVNGVPIWGHTYYEIPNADKAKITLSQQMQDAGHQIGMFLNKDGTPAQIGTPEWSLPDIAAKMSQVAQVKTGEQLLQLHKNDAHDLIGKPVEQLDDLATAVRNNPQMKTALRLYSKMAGTDSIDTILGRMNAVDPQSASLLMQYLHLTPKDLQDMDDTRKANAEKAKTAFNPDKQPASPALVKTFSVDIRKSYPSLTAGQVDSLTKQLGPNPTQKDYEAAQDRAEKYDTANSNRATKDAAQSGKNVEALLNYGVDPENPTNKLTIDSAALPGGMLVNSKTGQPIPLKMLSAVKPSQSEINREQFADSAIESMDKLNALISQAEASTGPISGRLDVALAKAGLGDKYQQELLDYMTFAQSAATGAHVGGRFNVPIMDKMSTVINPTMNKDQLQGAMYSIRSVMQNYKDNGGRFTVDEWRAMPPVEQQRLMGRSAADEGNTVRNTPQGRPVLRDGKVIGYTTDGKTMTPAQAQ